MRIKQIFKERWKFYLIGYIFGYIVSLLNTGVPNIMYLVPIKLTSVVCAIGIGPATYYGLKGMTVPELVAKGIKHAAIAGIVIIVFVMIESFLLKFGIDITPFKGF